MLLLVVVGAAVLIFTSAGASLSSDSSALAKITMPLGGGTIEKVSVVTGPHSTSVPVELRGDRIWPKGLVGVHEQLSIEVVIKRPGWIGWVAGKTQRLRLTVLTPSAALRAHYLTLKTGQPVTLHFKKPVAVLAWGPDAGHLTRRVLATPQSTITLNRTADAGTLTVAAAPRRWENPSATVVSWFPAGAAAAAVATPAPGTQILPTTKLTLTFNKTVRQALGTNRPPVLPITPGTWHTINSHQIQFQPLETGYGLGAKVSVALPSDVRLVGGSAAGGSSLGTWTVPGGSTLRLQQLLAQLGYLPVNFNGPSVDSTPQAQENAAIHPPSGSFPWAYPNVPDALRQMWSPGSFGELTRGALMMYENEHGLTPDGVAGPAVWRSLMTSALSAKRSSFGYTFVDVSLTGQTLHLWHNGKTVVTTAVNTGIAQAPTASGTYAVYEHLPVTTMSGTNPDGSHYNDPGIQWVSYFNGGDALHAFTRAQYGFPQSLGCVEMALGPAGQVYPYTPIGTIVHVA